MDQRLFEATLTGNVGELQQLLTEEPFILHRVASSSAETPLHLAAMAGHLSFVKEMIRLKPEFARELNQNGLTPIHLASANGFVDIVKELLKINHDDQCRLKCNRHGRTPLHYAAIKGRIDVINELLSSCVESIEDVTIQGETALHLSVKNNQFEAFRVMVEKIRQQQLNKENLVNAKDEEGNTVLHLSASTKQRQVPWDLLESVELEQILSLQYWFQVLKMLLVNDMGSSTIVVEVNAVNRCNLTALDLLLLLPNESTDGCIEEILRRAGAKRAEEVGNVHVVISTNTQASTSLSQSNTTTQSPFDRLVEFFKFQNGRDSPSEARSALLVIAVLIATATYQAVLSPPGGVWQDDSKKPSSAGKSILSTSNPILFGFVLFFNSAGFFASLFMIKILTEGFPLRSELHICIFAMIVTYDCAMVSLIPYNGVLSITFTVISSALPMVIPFLANRLRLWWIGWRGSHRCD